MATAVNSLFKQYMVLQYSDTCRVYGTSTAGVTLTVTLTNTVTGAVTTETCTTCNDGHWNAWFNTEALGYGGDYTLVAVGSDGVTITVTNVTIGDVIVVWGQSNALVTLGNETGGAAELAALTATPWTDVRLFRCEKDGYYDKTGVHPEAHDFQTASTANDNKWQQCTAANATGFSALGYYIAKYLKAATTHPIGIIQCAKGGTQIEEWTKATTFATLGITAHLPTFNENIASITNDGTGLYKVTVSGTHDFITGGQVTIAGADISNGTFYITVLDTSSFTLDGTTYVSDGGANGTATQNKTSNLWNGMIAPVSLYTVAAVVTNQGEADTIGYRDYKKCFSAMMQDWRTANGEIVPFMVLGLCTTGIDKYSTAYDHNIASITDSGVASDVGNKIRITTTGHHGYTDSSRILVSGTESATDADGSWVATLIDEHNIDLDNSTWVANSTIAQGTIGPALLDTFMGRLRWEQYETTVDVPKSYFISCADQNTTTALHYPTKSEVGYRAANAILTNVMGITTDYQGPTFVRTTTGIRKLTITFGNVGTGIGVGTPADPIRGYWVCNHNELGTYAAWVTGTAYVINDKVQNGSYYYRCLIAHTSGTFATDFTAGKWEYTSCPTWTEATATVSGANQLILTCEPTTWATSTVYAVWALVQNGTGHYRCLTAHTSGTFATDLAAGYWDEVPAILNDQPTQFRSYWHWYKDTNQVINSAGRAFPTWKGDIRENVPVPWGEPY